MRLAITCNGPGETAGWLRPLLREVYAQAPQTEAHVFYVPDDYATGQEPDLVRSLFPQARVYDPKTYLKVALGARMDGLPDGADEVLYLGGDLMHAARLHKRFGGKLASYKFSRPRYALQTARAFAVDDANRAQLHGWGVPENRIEISGNLAIDGAMIEASAPAEPGAPRDGVLFMPGSRGHEVEQMIPMFFTAALLMHREDPNLSIAFGISPFNKLSEIRAAMMAGGDPRVFAQRGTVIEDESGAWLSTIDGDIRFPVVRNALAAAKQSRLAVTIPGTKVIELAAIGKPVIAISPFNMPEIVTINGPLQYIDRIPFVGIPLKRTVVMAYARRHRFHTQPNMDAQGMLVEEVHSTVTPGRIARMTLDRIADTAWLESHAQALAALYREHVGAAGRMARSLLSLSGEA